MASLTPLGILVSFGSSATPAVANDRLVFYGTGQISPAAGPNAGMTPLHIALATTPLLDPPQPGGVYPHDRGGLSNLALKDPLLTCQYLLYSTSGVDATAWSAISAQWDQIRGWYEGTYAYNGTAGAGGQAGDLIVQDAGGTARTCQARWTGCEIPEWGPGEISFAWVHLTFVQLSAFA